MMCTKVCDATGRALASYATVLQVSNEGCMLRTDREIESGVEYQYAVASETVILDAPTANQQLARQVETLLLAYREQHLAGALAG